MHGTSPHLTKRTISHLNEVKDCVVRAICNFFYFFSLYFLVLSPQGCFLIHNKTVNQAVVQTSSQRESVRQLLVIFLADHKRKLLHLWKPASSCPPITASLYLSRKTSMQFTGEVVVSQSANELGKRFGGLPRQIAVMRLECDSHVIWICMTTTGAERIYYFAGAIRQLSTLCTLLGNSTAFWFGHVADQTFHESMNLGLCSHWLQGCLFVARSAPWYPVRRKESWNVLPPFSYDLVKILETLVCFCRTILSVLDG